MQPAIDRTKVITDYVDRGWVPFAYKAPTLPPFDWQHSKVTDTTVRECASTNDPIGIVLGRVSGIVVVDIDVQSGGSLDSFIDRYGCEDTRTYIVATPSGGYHLYYEHPADVSNLPKRINAGRWIDGLRGVDLLADGHHVQAPPTVRLGHPTKPDGEYRVLGDYPVAPVPAKLLADWLESLVVPGEVRGDPVMAIPDRDHSWVLGLHRRKVREAAESVVGTRDDTVYRCLCLSVRIAYYLPDSVLTVDEVEADYIEAYEAAQGESILDIDGKVKRALALAEENPWVVSDDNKVELPAGVSEDKRDDFVKRVDEMLLAKHARVRADQLFADAMVADIELPGTLTGAQLETDDGETQWVIEGLLAPAQSVLLSAQKKSGKTTLSLNLIRSLTTGEPFLGQYKPARPMRVAYFDLELGKGWRLRTGVKTLGACSWWSCYAAVVSVVVVVVGGCSGRGGSSSWWRSSWRWRLVADVWVTPRQPRLARSRTAHTSDRQLVSPGRRPMTLTRRRDSPKVRSMRLEWRMRVQCWRGKRKCTLSEAKSLARQATAAG